MPKVPKKKRFRGKNCWEVPSQNTDSGQDPNQISTPVGETASMGKLGKEPKNTSDVSDNSYSYRLVALSSLLKAFQPLHQCEVGGELTMSEDGALMYGNSSVIHIACTKGHKTRYLNV